MRPTKHRELALVVGSLGVALLALELGVRLHGHIRNSGLLGAIPSRGVEVPDNGVAELGHMIRPASAAGVVYELKPGLSVIYEGSRVTTDAAGFRTADSPESEPISREGRGGLQNVLRIVGIGDSFMFGQGVAESETYMSILRRRLQAAGLDRRVEVVNTAVPGYNTVMEVATLEAKGLAYAPDIVIIEFVGNDLSLPNFVLAPARPWSLRRSFLNDLVRERLGARRDQSLWRRLLDSGLRGVPQDDPDGIGNTIDPSRVSPELRRLVGWQSFDAAMHELQRLGAEHDFETVAISLDPADPPFETRALETARERGFHSADLGAVLRGYLDANGFVDYLGSPLARSSADGHPSALGHRLVGEALADLLIEQLLKTAKTGEER